jgi:hypothetical protein
MSNRSWLAALTIVLTASSCQTSPPPPAATPSLVEISGFGKWTKATATAPDTFGFAVRTEEVCTGPSSSQSCQHRYPDTAFVDFSIRSLTGFEVSSNGQVLTEVSQTATLGDFQFRKTAITDGSGAFTTWRIAVSVPSAGRKWCPPARFPLDIVNVTAGQPARSAALPVLLLWGKCQSNTFPGVWYSTGTTGTPPAASAPTPVGDCPGGAFARSFDVCERCGTSGLSAPKTFWGCTLAEAQQSMGSFGCVSVLRSGINCP